MDSMWEIMKRDIEELVTEFRGAIERAKNDGKFAGDLCFGSFPRACCGPTSSLLAEYLHKYGIDSIYVCGWRDDQSHVWLVIKDEKIREPHERVLEIPENIRDYLNYYSGGCYDEPDGETYYEERDIKDGLIIDITADQFPEMKMIPVYIGYMDSFHRKFKFDQAYDYVELCDARLERIYRQICCYL